MNMPSVFSTAKQEPKATMHLKVFRQATKTWEDGPAVNAVDVGLGRWVDVKLRVLSKLLKKANNLLKWLEEKR